MSGSWLRLFSVTLGTPGHRSCGETAYCRCRCSCSPLFNPEQTAVLRRSPVRRRLHRCSDSPCSLAPRLTAVDKPALSATFCDDSHENERDGALRRDRGEPHFSDKHDYDDGGGPVRSHMDGAGILPAVIYADWSRKLGAGFD